MQTIIVKCNSHRSRQKLERLLGYKPQSYYATPLFKAPSCTGGYHEIPIEKLADALKIKGITKASSKWEYAKCWDCNTTFSKEN